MLLGLLSDTHDRHLAARAAVAALVAKGAAQLIHCGDVCDEAVLDELVVENVPAAFVFGNNDWDHAGLKRYADSIGVTCLESFGSLDLAGKRIAVLHGDDGRRLRSTLEGGAYDYVFTGHTHVPMRRDMGRSTWINPGALHRAAKHTCCLLNLATGEVEWIEIGVK
jgi:putative phosphoesterase